MWRWLRRQFRPDPQTAEFLAWSEAQPTATGAFPTYEDWRNRNLSGGITQTEEQLRAQYLGELFSELEKNKNSSLTILEDFPNISDHRWNEIKEFGSLSFVKCNQDIKWHDKMIRSLSVEQTGKNFLELKKCFVGSLQVTGNPIERVWIEDSWIGKFWLRNCYYHNLEMKRGGVLGFDVPSPDDREKVSFGGPVKFDNVFFPVIKNLEVRTWKPYRDLRLHLENSGNPMAASVMHNAELAFDRQFEKFPARVLNWLYQVGSDYGGSIALPLFWFVFFVVLSSSLLGFSDGVALPEPDSLVAGSWQENLIDPGLRGQWLRAFVYSLQSAFNPIGIFGFRGLLTVNSLLIAIPAIVLSLFETASLALLVLAIRRRFKMN